MIKCNVTINGIVSRTASMRTNKEGKSYISFAVKISILAKAGSSKQVEVFVSKNGTTAELLSYVTGQRIELKGVLTFRKREETCISISMPTAWTSTHKASVMRLRALSSSGGRWVNKWKKRGIRRAMLIRCSPPSVQRSMRKTLLSHGYVLSVSPQKKKVGSSLRHVSAPKEYWNYLYIWTKSTSPAGWRKWQNG